MAVFSGTNIVNDGLVFHFDLQNSVKSWKGKPTSNLIDGGTNRADGVTSPKRTAGYSSIARTVVSEYYSEERPHVLHYYSTNDTGYGEISQQFSANNISGNIYTYSFDYKQIKGSDQALSSVIVYGNGYKQPDTGNYRSNLETSDISLEDGWFRKIITYTATYTGKNFLRMNLSTGGQRGTNEGDFEFYFDNFQMEEGSVATRYTSGIRLDTATIVDVSPKKNSIRAQNLTYRQDDTPTFDGTDDFFEITTTVNAKTVIAWIKIAVADGSEGIIYGPTANGHDNWFAIASNQVKIFATQTADVNNTSTFGGTELSANTWYQVGMSIDDDTVRAYLNGDLDGASVKAFTVGAWNSVASIGRRGNIAQRYFNGEIDQVKVYDRVLTADEIKQNFEATRSRYGI